ncbi:hypothetical protein RUM43_001606 [Polyplax serrata]|uniref:Leucine-rich repeat and WD repeat-containing protein 1 LRR domain-containing protein n=1 Tax=Polyplax serrata TaxID=468196 RepID=A0AAN8SEK9_POLSC
MDYYSVSDSDCSSEEDESSNLDLSYLSLRSDEIKSRLEESKEEAEEVTSILLYQNVMNVVPSVIGRFTKLRYLDLSSNRLSELPAEIGRCPLTTLIAKNNRLSDKSLPATFPDLVHLKELNLSGNEFSIFPTEVLCMKSITNLFMGGNNMTKIPKEISNLESLKVLSLGGNKLTEVPCTLGQLKKLTALILSDNELVSLPREIAKLRNLKSLLLHRNKLKTLPTEIVSLKCMTELSLRDNPLVVRFVSDMTYTVPSLLELAARAVKLHSVKFTQQDLPKRLLEYLNNARHCINPKCKGVFFDSRVEHVKFVDFCGKYRVPLLQYLCSSGCIDNKNEIEVDSGLIKKVLLG